MLKGPSNEKVEFNQRLDLDESRRPENLNGWAHLGIPVTDIVKSKNFYFQFGFKEIMYAEIPVNDEFVKASMIEKNGFVIELYQLLGEDVKEISERKDGHIDHIALDVLDVEKAFKELKEAGIEILEEVPQHLDFWENGVKYFNIRGPGGEKLEFSERIKS